MKLVFRAHALQRMFEREISVDDVQDVITNGEVVEDYPDDFPLASRLLLSFCKGRPIHVVVATSASDEVSIIITVYEPDPTSWSEDFSKRNT
ncbi:MAG: DUF4258 domain-containing protein [Fimbriimonadales bacterium]